MFEILQMIGETPILTEIEGAALSCDATTVAVWDGNAGPDGTVVGIVPVEGLIYVREVSGEKR